MRRSLVLSIVLLCAACKDRPVAPSRPPPSPGARPSGPPPAPPSPVEDPQTILKAKGAALVSDTTLASLAIHEEAMLPVIRARGEATRKPSPSEEDARAATAKETQMRASALAKAKLGEDEAEALSALTTEWYSKRFLLDRAKRELPMIRRRIAAAKARGKKPAEVDLTLERAALESEVRHKQERAEWETLYGKPVMALLDKHEVRFMRIVLQRMQAMMPAVYR